MANHCPLVVTPSFTFLPSFMELGHVGRAVAKGIPLVAKGFSHKTLTAISQALMHQKISN